MLSGRTILPIDLAEQVDLRIGLSLLDLRQVINEKAVVGRKCGIGQCWQWVQSNGNVVAACTIVADRQAMTCRDVLRRIPDCDQLGRESVGGVDGVIVSVSA